MRPSPRRVARRYLQALDEGSEDKLIKELSDQGWGKGALSKQRYWFHSSSADVRDSISQRGLLTKFDMGMGETPVGIYMTRRPNRDGWSDVWRVDVKGLRLVSDPWSGEHPSLGLSVFHRNDIPARRLRLVHKQRRFRE